MVPSNHLILCCLSLLLPSIFPSIRVFFNESALHIRWPKYWSFSISPSSEYAGLISFRIDRFDLLAVQGTLESLLQHCRPYRDAYQFLSLLHFKLCAWNSHEGIRSKLGWMTRADLGDPGKAAVLPRLLAVFSYPQISRFLSCLWALDTGSLYHRGSAAANRNICDRLSRRRMIIKELLHVWLSFQVSEMNVHF